MDRSLHQALGLFVAALMSAAPAGIVRSQTAEPIDEVLVTGRVERLYRVTETSVSKLPTEPLAASQAISVVTDQLIEDQGARDSQDLYRNISGISFFSYAGVTARGFRQEETFYDGLRGDPSAGFSVPQLFNIERVEFLKGPAGITYGQAAPGGVLNYVTRKPNSDPSIEIGVIGGTDNRGGTRAELNGGLTERLAGRIGTFYEQRDTHRFNADSETRIVDGGLAYDFGSIRATLQATQYDQDLGGNRLRGVPVDNTGEFLTTPEWNHNEAGDFLKLDADVLQLRVEGGGSAWSWNVAARRTDALETQQYHEPSGLFDSDANGSVDAVTREFRDQRRDTTSFSYGVNAIWNTESDRLQNRLLFGADDYDFDYVFDYRRSRGANTPRTGFPTPLSLFSPAYTVTNPVAYAFQIVNTAQQNESRRTGAYVVEEATLGRLILLAGARRDTFRDRQNAATASGDAWTYRVGTVFRAREDFSYFAQYATSFEPQTIAAADPRVGGPFDPTEGEIVEVGLKTALFNNRFQTSVALYEIKKENVLQTDPRGDVGGDGLDDFVSFGEVTSRGLDFELAMDVTPNWALTAVYAWNDTTVTEDNGGGGFANRVGDSFANAPKHQLGFWTRYQFPERGLAVAFGADHLSDRVSIDGQPVQSYYVFDASFIYERQALSVLLRIDNLFDEVYAASGFIRRTGHFPGEPRSAFAELRYRF